MKILIQGFIVGFCGLGLMLMMLIINVVDVQAATMTFYPSVDGLTYRVKSGGEDWASLRSGAGTNVDSSFSNDEIVSETPYGSGPNFYVLKRWHVRFDTSALPDEITITNAYLKVRGSSKYNGGGASTCNYVVTKSTITANSLSSTDYQSKEDTKLSNVLTYANYSTSGYNTWTLNSDGKSSISKTGYSAFTLRLSTYDVDGTTPDIGTADTSCRIDAYNSEYTGTSYDPYLEVEYSTAVCGNSILESGEACNDGNTNNHDGCSSSCTIEYGVCGNGIEESFGTSTEECDDGNLINTDSCSNDCKDVRSYFVNVAGVMGGIDTGIKTISSNMFDGIWQNLLMWFSLVVFAIIMFTIFKILAKEKNRKVQRSLERNVLRHDVETWYKRHQKAKRKALKNIQIKPELD